MNLPTAVQNFGKLDSGYYVAVACGMGIVTANTPLAPFVTGVLAIALIYQTNLWLKGK